MQGCDGVAGVSTPGSRLQTRVNLGLRFKGWGFRVMIEVLGFHVMVVLASRFLCLPFRSLRAPRLKHAPRTSPNLVWGFLGCFCSFRGTSH